MAFFSGLSDQAYLFAILNSSLLQRRLTVCRPVPFSLFLPFLSYNCGVRDENAEV